MYLETLPATYLINHLCLNALLTWWNGALAVTVQLIQELL